jgi:hypothetical protein
MTSCKQFRQKTGNFWHGNHVKNFADCRLAFFGCESATKHLRSELMALAAIRRRLLIHILDLLSGVCLYGRTTKTGHIF